VRALKGERGTEGALDRDSRLGRVLPEFGTAMFKLRDFGAEMNNERTGMATLDQEEQTLSQDEVFEVRRRHRANIPDLHHGAYRRLWDRAISGRDLRAAIKGKCQDCMAWQLTEIKICACVACPLYPYRITGRKIPRPAKSASTPAPETIGTP